MIELLAFPYAVGPRFVDAVMTARGGNSGLDGAFTSPPKTSSEVIHPDRFLGGFAPADVAAPAAAGPEFDHGVLGEMGLTLLLERLIPRPLTASDARDLAQGWHGDRYVAWDAGSKTCVRAAFVMETPTDTQELVRALQRWARTHASASVTGAGPVTLTSCG